MGRSIVTLEILLIHGDPYFYTMSLVSDNLERRRGIHSAIAFVKNALLSL
jgi:hypothetical protein